ncbi:MAG: two-component system, OmpR family, sensor histidine kinase KdpD, partial [Solirubrobacteraceae bacterium]|nr:two-component system, OmpR family, sensor histidine kinase KdpD [Solirubrobacteraceae bacterium]
MSVHPLSLLLRPTSPPLVVGVVVAAAFIGAETLVLYPLRRLAPEVSLGVVYLLGVVVVSTLWGLALGAATSAVSAIAFDFFRVPPAAGFVPTDSPDWVALAILLVVALLLSSVGELARSRAAEADDRRAEADLAADMARLLLRTDDLHSALREASQRLVEGLGLPDAAIVLEPVTGDEAHAAFPLRNGAITLGMLVLPAGLPHATEQRVRERVVPSVEALLRAAREREAIRSALEASRDELRPLAQEQAALRRVA